MLGPAIATTLLALRLDWRLIYLVFAGVVGLTVAGTLWLCTQTDDCAVAAPGTDARENLRLADTYGAGGKSLLLVYVGTEASVGNWAQVSTSAEGRVGCRLQRQCLLGGADNWTFEHGAPSGILRCSTHR